MTKVAEYKIKKTNRLEKIIGGLKKFEKKPRSFYLNDFLTDSLDERLEDLWLAKEGNEAMKQWKKGGKKTVPFDEVMKKCNI